MHKEYQSLQTDEQWAKQLADSRAQRNSISKQMQSFYFKRRIIHMGVIATVLTSAIGIIFLGGPAFWVLSIAVIMLFLAKFSLSLFTAEKFLEKGNGVFIYDVGFDRSDKNALNDLRKKWELSNLQNQLRQDRNSKIQLLIKSSLLLTTTFISFALLSPWISMPVIVVSLMVLGTSMLPLKENPQQFIEPENFLLSS